MIKLKNKEEIELMRQSALLVSNTLSEVAKILKPGITTLSIDQLIGKLINSYDATPSFLNYHGYPFNSCISVNDVVVHGFPNKNELKEGDLVSVDIGVYKNGFHGDHAYTFLIGKPSDEVIQLVKVTKESLYKGIEKAVVGNRVGDISYAIQEHTEKKIWIWCGTGISRAWIRKKHARRSASAKLWPQRYWPGNERRISAGY